MLIFNAALISIFENLWITTSPKWLNVCLPFVQTVGMSDYSRTDPGYFLIGIICKLFVYFHQIESVDYYGREFW